MKKEEQENLLQEIYEKFHVKICTDDPTMVAFYIHLRQLDKLDEQCRIIQNELNNIQMNQINFLNDLVTNLKDYHTNIENYCLELLSQSIYNIAEETMLLANNNILEQTSNKAEKTISEAEKISLAAVNAALSKFEKNTDKLINSIIAETTKIKKMNYISLTLSFFGGVNLALIVVAIINNLIK